MNRQILFSLSHTRISIKLISKRFRADDRMHIICLWNKMWGWQLNHSKRRLDKVL